MAVEPKSILVVDDETYTRELLEMLLGDEGYKVKTAKDGFEAIDLIKKRSFDLICMDVRMPGLNGVETLAEIRKVDDKIPVIMITGYGPNELVKKAQDEYHIVGCIYKPFDIDEFLAEIKSAINKK
ncbi:MAG: response regulator [Candidatus Margulisiibacteriota bacterium]|jgi:DNA-binding NtrC family response regulator